MPVAPPIPHGAKLFWLREAEEMETVQLCQQLDVSASNVWTLLHRTAPACASASQSTGLKGPKADEAPAPALKLLLLMNCREAAPLISQSLDRRLGLCPIEQP